MIKGPTITKLQSAGNQKYAAVPVAPNTIIDAAINILLTFINLTYSITVLYFLLPLIFLWSFHA